MRGRRVAAYGLATHERELKPARAGAATSLVAALMLDVLDGTRTLGAQIKPDGGREVQHVRQRVRDAVAKRLDSKGVRTDCCDDGADAAIRRALLTIRAVVAVV